MLLTITLLFSPIAIGHDNAACSVTLAETAFQQCQEFEMARNTSFVVSSFDQTDILATAVSQIGASSVDLVIDKPVFLSSNLVIPNNIRVDCREGGQITTKGHALIINGPFEAGPHECFLSSPGEVSFGASSAKTVLPQWFGASADGRRDCAPALRTALASLPNGGHVFLPDGSYYLNSYDHVLMSQDEYVTIKVPSNVALECRQFRSAKLKLSPTLQSTFPVEARLSFIGTPLGTTGQTINNLEFDYNGIVLDKPFRSYNAVYSLGTHVVLENLYIPNAPGRNMIIVGNFKLNDYTGFNTIRNVTIINGSKNVYGNTNADDASFIYLNGSNNIVEDSTFYNESPPLTNCGGVEFHCTKSSIRNCRFQNLYPAIYVGYERYSRIAEDIEIRNNIFDHCCGGIESVDHTSGMMIMYNNFISCNCLRGKWAIMTPRNDITGMTSAGTQDKVNIRYNTFTGLNTIRVAGYSNSVISGNRWIGTNIGIEFVASLTETANIEIVNNNFIDPVSQTNYDAGQVTIEGFDSNVEAKFAHITIEDNNFKSATPLDTHDHLYPFLASGSDSTEFTDIIARNNSFVNMSDKAAGRKAIKILAVRHAR